MASVEKHRSKLISKPKPRRKVIKPDLYDHSGPITVKGSIRSFVTAAIVAICLLSCDSATYNGKRSLFEPISSAKSKITFSNTLTENEDFNLIEYLYFYNGGGVALGDINNDGLVDIYLSANQLENKLYLNKGNWQFEDITETAGVGSPGPWKTGVTMADVNGDGLLDIYQCRLGGYKGIAGKNQLFINNGDLTFTERAGEYNLDFSGFSTQAAFFDYDLDGDLDVYLLNHSVHTERSYGRATLRQYDDSKAGDRLFKNNSDTGVLSFTSVTREAGIYSSHIGYGLGVGVSDVNGDGWPDIYISNDFNENDYLYINNGASGEKPVTFTESISSAIGHTSRFSMGNDLADYNNDGRVDIISLDMLPDDERVVKLSAGEDSYQIYSLKLEFGYGRQFARNTLQLNQGQDPAGVPIYAEIGQLAGVHATDWSWSALFADYDNDGYKDLFISNGIRRRPNDMDYINFISSKEIPDGLVNQPDLSDLALVNQMPDGAVPNYFFKNNGDLTFKNMSSEWGMSAPTLSNGAAYADLDNDGDLDLVINNINQQASLMRNYTRENIEHDSTSQAYLHIIAKGNGNNTFGIGLKALAYAGGRAVMQENFSSRGFQSSVPPHIHIGLGNIHLLDSLRVLWPGGKTQLIKEVEVNRTLEVSEAEASEFYIRSFTPGEDRSEPLGEPLGEPLFKDYTTQSGVDFRHQENHFNDFNREFLLPHAISREGPKIAVADYNSDGKDDFYVGNATGAEGRLYQQSDGATFFESAITLTKSIVESEETAAIAFDANGDHLPDLYITTGGNEVVPPNPLLQDHLLLNTGSGFSEPDRGDLPELFQHGAVVVDADIDQDGDQDLFVGGRAVPGQYGITPHSYILLNNGSGKFTEATASIAPELLEVGMVKDAKWADLNGDAYPDLIVAGEWMALTVFYNNNGQLERAAETGLENTTGWWNCIETADFDNDGDIDFVAGNLGSNSRLKPSQDYPLHLYIQDFDDNGSLEQIMAYSTPEGIFTTNTKDELIKQMPSLKKKYVKHQDFAGKTVDEIFGKEELEKSLHLSVNTFQSVYVENMGNGRFRTRSLPLEAQFFPVMAMTTADLNNDGHPDIVAGGNLLSTSPYFGTYDAGKGLVLLGDGRGNFTPLPQHKSGLRIDGEIRDIKILKTGEKLLFIIARNNDKLLIYELNESFRNNF